MLYVSGNVGIGTTGPATPLHIYGTSPSLRVESTGTGNDEASITLYNNAGTFAAYEYFGSNFVSGLANRAEFSTNGAGGFIIATRANAPLTFHTNSDGLGSNERLRIDGGGNIGIGTTGPGARLEVVGAPVAHSGSVVTFTNPTTYNAQVNLNSTSTGNTNFGFQESGVTKGAVGWSVANDEIFFWNAVASASNVSMKILSSGDTAFYNVADVAEKVRIMTTGNVGIGTTGPGAALHISGINKNFRIENTNGAANYNIYELQLPRVVSEDEFQIKNIRSSAIPFFIGGTTDANSIGLGGTTANTSPVLYIKGSGNVGIGTTSPTNLLSLGGNSARIFWLERHTTANTRS